MKFFWIMVKLVGIILFSGFVFYSRFCFPYHTDITFCILTAALFFFIFWLARPIPSSKGLSFVFTVSFTLASIAFGVSGNARESIADKNSRMQMENKMEQVYELLTYPLYQYLMKQFCDIKLIPSDYGITRPQIDQLKSLIEPGDIILLRKNNFLSNSVIKGFWKHMVIYCGSVADLEQSFSLTCKSEYGVTIPEYLIQHMASAYDQLSQDRNLDAGTVVESTSQGVGLHTLEQALISDYIAVLRPRLSKKEKLSVVLYALAQLNKPYDFNFDFTDDNAFTCSELVFKAFLQGVKGACKGLIPQLSLVNGRQMVVPNDFVREFDRAYTSGECSYDFVLYLDSRIQLENDGQQMLTDFRNSWRRFGPG